MRKCLNLKTVLISFVILFSSLNATASDIDTVVAECERQMQQTICTVQLDASQYDPTAKLVIPGVGRVSLASYIKLRSADKEMCNMAKKYCTEYPDGDECKIAKSFWNTSKK